MEQDPLVASRAPSAAGMISQSRPAHSRSSPSTWISRLLATCIVILHVTHVTMATPATGLATTTADSRRAAHTGSTGSTTVVAPTGFTSNAAASHDVKTPPSSGSMTTKPRPDDLVLPTAGGEVTTVAIGMPASITALNSTIPDDDNGPVQTSDGPIPTLIYWIICVAALLIVIVLVALVVNELRKARSSKTLVTPAFPSDQGPPRPLNSCRSVSQDSVDGHALYIEYRGSGSMQSGLDTVGRSVAPLEKKLSIMSELMFSESPLLTRNTRSVSNLSGTSKVTGMMLQNYNQIDEYSEYHGVTDPETGLRWPGYEYMNTVATAENSQASIASQAAFAKKLNFMGSSWGLDFSANSANGDECRRPASALRSASRSSIFSGANRHTGTGAQTSFGEESGVCSPMDAEPYMDMTGPPVQVIDNDGIIVPQGYTSVAHDRAAAMRHYDQQNHWSPPSTHQTPKLRRGVARGSMLDVVYSTTSHTSAYQQSAVATPPARRNSGTLAAQLAKTLHENIANGGHGNNHFSRSVFAPTTEQVDPWEGEESPVEPRYTAWDIPV